MSMDPRSAKIIQQRREQAMAHSNRSGSPDAAFVARLRRRAAIDRLALEANGMGDMELRYTTGSDGQPELARGAACAILVETASRGGKGSGSVGKGSKVKPPKGVGIGPRKPGPIKGGTTKGKAKRMTKGQAQRIVAGL